MKPSTFIALLETGTPVIVQFNDRANDWDGYFDPKMKAVATAVLATNDKEVAEIVFDVQRHDKHNAVHEQCTYWDEFGEATLSAREAGCHPEKNGWKETVYITANDDCEMPFDPVVEFLPTSYVAKSGAWHYELTEVDAHWIVRRRQQTSTNVIASWEIAETEGWGALANSTGKERKFDDYIAASNFVIGSGVSE